MRNKRPTPIDAILKETIKQIEDKKKGSLSEEEIMSAWRDVAGGQAAQHSVPVKINKDILTINVDSPTWIYQLNIKKRKIEDALNRKIDRSTPLKIRFRAGENA